MDAWFSPAMSYLCESAKSADREYLISHKATEPRSLDDTAAIFFLVASWLRVSPFFFCQRSSPFISGYDGLCGCGRWLAGEG